MRSVGSVGRRWQPQRAEAAGAGGRAMGWTTPPHHNINSKTLKNLINFSEFKLFKIIYKINYKYIKIYILKKLLTNIILNSENIRQHQYPSSLYHLIVVSKRYLNRFLPIKAKRDLL